MRWAFHLLAFWCAWCEVAQCSSQCLHHRLRRGHLVLHYYSWSILYWQKLMIVYIKQNASCTFTAAAGKHRKNKKQNKGLGDYKTWKKTETKMKNKWKKQKQKWKTNDKKTKNMETNQKKHWKTHWNNQKTLGKNKPF